MPVEIHDELMNACEFEDAGGRLGKIPAETFAKALKRFALRVLSVKPVDENLELNSYLGQMNFWSDVSKEVVEDYFPENLLVAHSYSAYCAIKMKIDVSIILGDFHILISICVLTINLIVSYRKYVLRTRIKAKKAQKQKFSLR